MKNIYTYDGVDYLTGSAGSLILGCPKCGHGRSYESYITARVAEEKIKNTKTLRDEFACAAMQALIIKPSPAQYSMEGCVHWAYRYAHEMLKEREKVDNEN